MRTRRGFARHFVVLGAVGPFAVVALLLPTVQHARQSARYAATHTNLRQLDCALAEASTSCESREPIAVPRYGISTTDGEVTLQELPGREIKNEELAGVEWRGVNLRGVAFTECDLRKAHLEWADLRGVFFSECDLRGANLDGANLTGVLYSSGTQWPAGFDPKAHGARLDE